MKRSVLIGAIIFNSFAYAQDPPGADQMKAMADGQMTSAIANLRTALSIPNDANYPDHVAANVSWARSVFEERGFQIQTLETGGPPILLASKIVAQAQKTVLIYLQIDGQPVDSSKWDQESPYTPVLKQQKNVGWVEMDWELFDGNDYDPEWRIFARSTSDSKGAVSMLMAALDAINERNLDPNYSIKIIMDFEEELGSPHLPSAIKKYAAELSSDMLIIFDGPRHIVNQPTLTFGARGISTLTLTVFGPLVPQHSGHYGNYVPNPALKLSKLLGSMKDNQGRVLIPGYYDGIEIDNQVKKILSEVPDDETAIQRRLGISEADKVAGSYQLSIQYPSLNIRGMQSAWIGDKVRTIVPATATAEIDVRIVMETDPERLVRLIRDHIEGQGFHIISGEPTDEERLKYPDLVAMTTQHSYNAFRTPFDSEVGVWLNKALIRTFDKEPIRIRTSGGSIPIEPFVTTLGIPAVTVPTVNRDNNQHSPNENIRLGNIRDGIRTFIGILTEPLE